MSAASLPVWLPDLAMLPLLPVSMDVAQRASIEIRGEERVRSGTDVTAEESEANPQLRYDLIWQNGESHFVALYNPRFIYTYTSARAVPDPNLVDPETLNTADPNDTPTSALHNGGVGFEMIQRRYRISAYQFGAYGPITTTALLVQPPWNGDGLPADPNPIIPSTVSTRFRLLFIQTQVFVPIRLSRRVALTPGFVYNAFGGADSASRGAIALTSGPGGSLALEVAATRNDRFISMIGGGRIQAEFQGDRTGPVIYRGEATQSWRHWLSESLSTEVSAGAQIGGNEIAGTSLYGTAQAGLLYDSYPQIRIAPGAPPQGGPPGRGNHLQVGLVAKAGPWLDLFSGQLEERVVGTAAVNYTIDRTTFQGSLSAANVVNTPQNVSEYVLFQGVGAIRYQLAEHLSADGGVRLGYQNLSNAIRHNELSQSMLFVGFAWTPLPARF